MTSNENERLMALDCSERIDWVRDCLMNIISANGIEMSNLIDELQKINDKLKILAIPTIDLDQSCWKAIKNSMKKTKAAWNLPDEYTLGDMVSDICSYIENPLPPMPNQWTKEPPTEAGYYWHTDDQAIGKPCISFVQWSAESQKCFVKLAHCDVIGGYWMKIDPVERPEVL